MTVQKTGPGGISNSYGQRVTSQPSKIAQAGENHGIYNEFSAQPDFQLSNVLQGKRMEALFKPAGIAGAGYAYNQSTGLSATTLTTTVKAELETDASAVRLVFVNRAANAITGVKAVVGVTETADFSTSAKIGSPTINGTTYQALQGATDVLGWRAVTIGGASSTTLPAATTAQQVVLSDWAYKSTIPRADGGTRPLALWRVFVDGSVTNTGFLGTYQPALNTPSAPMRNRIIQNSVGFGDGISNLALSVGAGTTVLETYPIYRFNTPVFSVWGCGDSIEQQDSLVADKTSNYIYRACLDVSTPAKPVVYANMAGSSQTSTTYIATLRQFLSAGVPPPSCLIVPPVSTNDAALNSNLTEQAYSKIIEIIKLCADYEIPFLIFLPWLQSDNYNLAQDAIRRATDDKIKAIAASYGVRYVDFPQLGNGAYPERWIAEYKYDAVHPNEKAIENVMAPAIRSVLKNLV